MNIQKNIARIGPAPSKKPPRSVAELPELVAHVSRQRSLAETATEIARAFVLRVHACSSRVYLLSGDGATLYLAAAENVDPSRLVRSSLVPLDDGSPAAAAVRLGLLHVAFVDDTSRSDYPLDTDGVVLALPLFAGGKTMGAIVADFGDLSPAQCLELKPLSDSLGALLDRARLGDEVAHLQGALRARDEQTAQVVHDLRQPLTAILVGAKYVAARSEGIRGLLLERVCASCGHLDRMISDLSDGLFEANGVTLLRAPTDLVELATRVAELYFPATEIVVEGQIPLIDVDGQRVEQILGNLLANARKYGRAGGVTAISLIARTGRIVVSVTNEGEPIPDDEHLRVFEVHYRGRAQKSRSTGQGLGLFICKKLVEAHSGRIWVDLAAEGTRFSFSLPLLTAPALPSRGPGFAVVKCRSQTSTDWTLDSDALEEQA